MWVQDAYHIPHCHAFVGPYVTAVGGTTEFDPERGATMSGGGFSDYFDRPPYQDEAVPPFLQKLGNQYQGLFKWVRLHDLI